MIRKSLFLLVLALFGWTVHANGLQEGSHMQDAGPVLDGLDPVALVDGKKAEGNPQWSAIHDDYRYFFSSQENLERFNESPGDFVVQDHGNCPVAKVMMNKEVKGKPEIYSVHEGKVYLFSRQDAKQAFDANPAKFTGDDSRISSPREGSGF